MFLNCGAGEDFWESFGQQGGQTSPILKEINPEYSWEGLMVKLKRQYFGHLMWRMDSLEKTLMLRKTEDRKRGQQRRWLDGITQLIGHDFEQTLGDSEGQGSQESCNPWDHKASDMTQWGNNNNWYHKGFPVGSAVKNLPTETGPIPGLGGCPGKGTGNLLQFLAWEIWWTEEPG